MDITIDTKGRDTIIWYNTIFNKEIRNYIKL